MACSISRQALACRLFAEHHGREHDASTMMRTGMIMRMVDTGCFCTDTGGHDRSWRQNLNTNDIRTVRLAQKDMKQVQKCLKPRMSANEVHELADAKHITVVD